MGQRSKEPRDQDKQLALAKEMINSTKGEENNIFEAVDQHAAGIVGGLDEERVNEYLELRERIARTKGS